ncbi:MAG TPA: hypothetical protein VEZ46_13480, partial [Mycobacteriales bacterium]|nr:hypothetical protein [Mycobacteriales bacterium]
MRQRAAPRSLSCRLDAGVGCSCESSIGSHTHPDGGSPAIDERHVDELYGLPPEEFVTRRDALARELRSSDRGASAEIKALRRPTVGAWLVNQLARAEAEALDELLETGAALRDTQAAVVAGQAEGAAL